MKSIPVFLFLLIPFAGFTQTKTYTVVLTVGNVYQLNKQRILAGDKLSSKDIILFHSCRGYLVVLGPAGRRKVSLDPGQKPGSNGYISAVVGEHLSSHAYKKRFRTKEMIGEMELFNFFKPSVMPGEAVNDRILVTDPLMIPIRKTDRFQTDNRENFFALQFTSPDGKVTIHRLSVVRDTLVFPYSALTFNNSLYYKAMGILKLVFIRNYSKTPVVEDIAVIDPIFGNRAEVARFIHFVRVTLPKLSREEIIDEAYTELCLYEGKYQRQIIADLYDREWEE